MPGTGTVFDHIVAQMQQGKTLQDQFMENLKHVYEFDATEIQDFVLNHESESADSRRANILQLRQSLFENLCDKIPAYQGRELFNRRKVEIMAQDVYILGNAVVNNLSDKRLSKVLKPSREPLQSQSGGDDTLLTGPLVDNEDLIQTVADLKVNVSTLENTVKQLADTIKSLEQHIGQLNQRLDAASNPSGGPTSGAATQPVARSGPANQGSNTDDTPLAHPQIPPPQQPGRNGILPPPDVRPRDLQGPAPRPNVPHARHPPAPPVSAPPPSVQWPSLRPAAAGNDHRRETSQDGFQLQSHQRRDALRGNNFASSNSQEIKGSSTAAMRISGVSVPNSGNVSTKSTYVGQLHDQTTAEMVRRHLIDIGVDNRNVCDVIKLNSKLPHQASFCVIVDAPEAERRLYHPNNWPVGVRVRPYHERRRGQMRPQGGNRITPQQPPSLLDKRWNNRFTPLRDQRIGPWM